MLWHKPKNPTPLLHLKQASAWHIANHLGFLDESGERMRKDVAFALAAYWKAFVFEQHTGVYVRSPTPETKEKILADFPDNLQQWRGRIAYTGTAPLEGHCRMYRRKSGEYHAIAGAAESRGEPLGWPELDGLDRRRPSKLCLRDLLLFLLRGDNPLMLKFCHLEPGKDSLMKYFVLDLDDHDLQETHQPCAPSPVIQEMLADLRTVEVLRPEHSGVFTSPSGRGRHLYYFLDTPLPAETLKELVQDLTPFSMHIPANLADAKYHMAEVFPKPKTAMPPLPLCRGSYLCDHNGVPLPVLSSIREELFRLQDLLLNRAACVPVACLQVPVSIPVAAGVPPPLQTPEPAGPSRPPVPLVAPTGRSPRDWYERGLTRPGQRREGTLAVAVYCRQQGMTRAAAVRATTQWLHEKHNNQSRDYSRDRRKALKFVGIAVKMAYRGREADTGYALAVADVSTIASAIMKAAPSARRLYKLGEASA